MSSVDIDAVRLTLVLGNLMMDKGDDVRTNRSSEHSWETDNSLATYTLLRVDGDQRAGSTQRLNNKKTYKISLIRKELFVKALYQNFVVNH